MIRGMLKITFILIFVNSVNVFAQTETKISPEKKRLIAELIKVTKAGAQVVEITDTMLASMEKTYPLAVKQALRREGQLTEADQEKLTARISASFQSFSKKFRERLPKEIDYDNYVKDMVYPLYDKFFTEKELADLVAFYKTETGQKVVTTMPKLVNESTKLTETLLLPKILDLVDRIMNEEMDTFEDSLTKTDGR